MGIINDNYSPATRETIVEELVDLIVDPLLGLNQIGFLSLITETSSYQTGLANENSDPILYSVPSLLLILEPIRDPVSPEDLAAIHDSLRNAVDGIINYYEETLRRLFFVGSEHGGFNLLSPHFDLGN